MEKENLLNVNETAEFLNVKSGTIRYWRNRGFLPVVKIQGTIRFRKSDLQQLIIENFIPVREAKKNQNA
ncbi:MAG: hypothetical protein A2Y79_04845 [Deltaproteobacteria bacterium RBG_13_43_22]|nr:MAG: hypothetical protein A2Y79_04845 [Deltaproteobacteria bacterium RBG_13_43_22]